MKRMLAALMAAAVSTAFCWYGGFLVLLAYRAPTAQLVAAAYALYGLLTGVLLVMAWFRPDRRYGKWALQLAAVPAVLWLGMLLQASLTMGMRGEHLPGLAGYQFLMTIGFGLLLAAHVGCIRFISAARNAPA